MPGGTIQLDYINQMSTSSREVCVDGPCMNMTNLHFHGLHVSPDAPGDDVLTMMAMPGQSLGSTVDIPANRPPGLYWYHTHPHGESYQQDLDGMSGAIVIEGMERYFPEIKQMKEKILILRDAELEQNNSSSSLLKNAVQLAPYDCGTATGEATRIFTVNGVVRPHIAIAAGEKQFWRIVNASPDLYADLQVDFGSMTLLALDGMPLTYHDPTRHPEELRHVLLAPAGRAEVIVVGPKPERPRPCIAGVSILALRATRTPVWYWLISIPMPRNSRSHSSLRRRTISQGHIQAVTYSYANSVGEVCPGLYGEVYRR